MQCKEQQKNEIEYTKVMWRYLCYCAFCHRIEVLARLDAAVAQGGGGKMLNMKTICIVGHNV